MATKESTSSSVPTGPDGSSELVYIDDEDPRIIHAMPLRHRFYRYLPR